MLLFLWLISLWHILVLLFAFLSSKYVLNIFVLAGIFSTSELVSGLSYKLSLSALSSKGEKVGERGPPAKKVSRQRGKKRGKAKEREEEKERDHRGFSVSISFSFFFFFSFSPSTFLSWQNQRAVLFCYKGHLAAVSLPAWIG